ncbi:MAG: hypothetical protein ACAI35_19125 [Candidatus Methylacidiphilales bacterium]|nr:hypothetical protein [Candidatus Methylacidiphilales bacterium]
MKGIAEKRLFRSIKLNARPDWKSLTIAAAGKGCAGAATGERLLSKLAIRMAELQKLSLAVAESVPA